MSPMVMRGAILLAGALIGQLPLLGHSVSYAYSEAGSQSSHPKKRHQIKKSIASELPAEEALEADGSAQGEVASPAQVDVPAPAPSARAVAKETEARAAAEAYAEAKETEARAAPSAQAEAKEAEAPEADAEAKESGARAFPSAPKVPPVSSRGDAAYDVAWSWQTMESVGEPKAQQQARFNAIQRDVFSSLDAFAVHTAAIDEIARAQDFLAMAKFAAKAGSSASSSAQAAPAAKPAAVSKAAPAAKPGAASKAVPASKPTAASKPRGAHNSQDAHAMTAGVSTESPLASEALSDAQKMAAAIIEQEEARWHDMQANEVALKGELTSINQSLQQIEQTLGDLNAPKMFASVGPIINAVQEALKQGEAVVLAYKSMNGPNNVAVSNWFASLSSNVDATFKQFHDSTAAAAAKSEHDITAIIKQLVQAGELVLSRYQISMDLLDEVQANRGVAAQMLALQLHLPTAASVVDTHHKSHTGHELGNKEPARSYLLKRAGKAALFKASSTVGMDLDQAFFKKGSQSDCDKAKDSMQSAKATLADFGKEIASVSTSLPMLLSPPIEAATNAFAHINSHLIPLLDVPLLSSPSSSALSSALHSSFAALANFPAQLNSTVQTAVTSADSALKSAVPLLQPVHDVSAQLLSSLESTCSVTAANVMTSMV